MSRKRGHPSLSYKEIQAPADAAPYVECLWIFCTGTLDEPAPLHIIVPDGTVSVTFMVTTDGRCTVRLTGPSCRAHQVRLAAHTVYGGVRLHPGAAGAVLKTDIRNYRDFMGPFTDPLPTAVGRAYSTFKSRYQHHDPEPALSAAAQALVDSAGPPDAPVCAFARAIMDAGGDVVLGTLAEKFPLGPRQLRRRFVYQCGLTPKELARVRRVRQSCIELVQSPSCLAATALRAGFSDQAHMTREFRDVFRNSASLVRAYLRQISHEALVITRRL